MATEYQEYEEELRYSVLFCTTKDEDEGRKIARELVEGRLAACVSILKGVTSIFTWKGALDEVQECLLILKTRSDLVPELISRIKALHSYDVPEIIALPITEGNPAYLSWIDDVTG